MSENKHAAPMNPVVHFEMPYENRERLVKFYQNVFSWEMLETGKEMGDYVIAVTSETDDNRMVKRPDHQRRVLSQTTRYARPVPFGRDCRW